MLRGPLFRDSEVGAILGLLNLLREVNLGGLSMMHSMHGDGVEGGDVMLESQGGRG